MKKRNNKRILLHQSSIKKFIDNRSEFFQIYFNGYREPDHDYYQIGREFDIAVKNYYLGNEKTSDSFKTLSDLNQIIVTAMVNGYKLYYKEEYFKNIRVVNYQIPFENIMIYLSPDLVAENYEDEFWIIELKTSARPETLQALDFQTMSYIWAKYKWDYQLPRGVLKRIIRKPLIKQTKKETFDEFADRLFKDYVNRPDFYFIARSEKVDKAIIKNFEKYLREICKEMYSVISSKNQYKFWRPTDVSWEE